MVRGCSHRLRGARSLERHLSASCVARNDSVTIHTTCFAPLSLSRAYCTLLCHDAEASDSAAISQSPTTTRPTTPQTNIRPIAAITCHSHQHTTTHNRTHPSRATRRHALPPTALPPSAARRHALARGVARWRSHHPHVFMICQTITNNNEQHRIATHNATRPAVAMACLEQPPPTSLDARKEQLSH